VTVRDGGWYGKEVEDGDLWPWVWFGDPPVATTSPTPSANGSNSSTARNSRRPSNHPLSFAHNASEEETPKSWKNVGCKLISCL